MVLCGLVQGSFQVVTRNIKVERRMNSACVGAADRMRIGDACVGRKGKGPVAIRLKKQGFRV